MTIAHSLITKLLIEKWSNNPAMATGVPYRQMASDAADAASEFLEMLEGALIAHESSWPTAEPDWYNLYCAWKHEMINKNTGVDFRFNYDKLDEVDENADEDRPD